MDQQRVNPRFPIYVVSKGRAATATTPRFLAKIGVPHLIVVERPELDVYAEHFERDRLLVLDPAYQEDYDTCDELADAKSRGPGPARNFAWEHSIAAGASWHWVMDDNIKYFGRWHENHRVPVGDGTAFHAMETFTLRWRNVGMAGPNYKTFIKARKAWPPYYTGGRIYSCNLIRNALPFRWRGRYNEDTDLSLRLLKRGWNTIQFNAFYQDKVKTQTVRGGCTDDFYRVEGTLPKSEMLVRLHPDVARLTWRFGRAHHYVDYRRFRTLTLVPDETFNERFDYEFRQIHTDESVYAYG